MKKTLIVLVVGLIIVAGALVVTDWIKGRKEKAADVIAKAAR